MHIFSKKKSLCYLESDDNLKLVYVKLPDFFARKKNYTFYLGFVF